jgi:hypothetical protein
MLVERENLVAKSGFFQTLLRNSWCSEPGKNEVVLYEDHRAAVVAVLRYVLKPKIFLTLRGRIAIWDSICADFANTKNRLPWSMNHWLLQTLLAADKHFIPDLTVVMVEALGDNFSDARYFEASGKVDMQKVFIDEHYTTASELCTGYPEMPHRVSVRVMDKRAFRMEINDLLVAILNQDRGLSKYYAATLTCREGQLGRCSRLTEPKYFENCQCPSNMKWQDRLICPVCLEKVRLWMGEPLYVAVPVQLEDEVEGEGKTKVVEGIKIVPLPLPSWGETLDSRLER